MEPFDMFWSVYDGFGCFGKTMSRRNFCFWNYWKILIFKKVRAQNILDDIFHNSFWKIFFKNIFLRKKSKNRFRGKSSNLKKIQNFEKIPTSKKYFFEIYNPNFSKNYFFRNIFFRSWNVFKILIFFRFDDFFRNRFFDF